VERIGNREMQSSHRQHTDWYNSVCESVNTAVVTKFIKQTATEFHVTGNITNSINVKIITSDVVNNFCTDNIAFCSVVNCDL